MCFIRDGKCNQLDDTKHLTVSFFVSLGKDLERISVSSLPPKRPMLLLKSASRREKCLHVVFITHRAVSWSIVHQLSRLQTSSDQCMPSWTLPSRAEAMTSINAFFSAAWTRSRSTSTVSIAASTLTSFCKMIGPLS